MAVNAWYWRADENGRGRQVLAEGLGTTRTIDEELVRGNGVYENGRWHVVITRAMKVQSSENPAQLEPGQATGFGVAVWEGSRGERAGIKAISGDDWIKLDLEAASAATA
jgi:DMSO reductase family type II enzyme heme b subunit